MPVAHSSMEYCVIISIDLYLFFNQSLFTNSGISSWNVASDDNALLTADLRLAIILAVD